MADAALADLKDPKADQEVDMPFFWPTDLSDLYRYSDNDVHYDTNQDLAVVEIKHEVSANHHRTKVRVRGSPIGQYMTWLGRGNTGPTGGGGPGGTAFPPRPFITPLNTEADNTVWNLRFNSLFGSGGGGANLTYTIKTKTAFGSETTVASGTAADFPKDQSITRHLKEDKLVTFTVSDAATGMSALAQVTVPAAWALVSANGTHIMGAGTTPSFVVNAGPGGMGTSPTGTITGKDMAGFIHTVVGTSPASTGDVGTVTFATAFDTAPQVVIVPASAGAWNYEPYARAVTTTEFIITGNVTYGGAGAILDFYYMVIG